ATQTTSLECMQTPNSPPDNSRASLPGLLQPGLYARVTRISLELLVHPKEEHASKEGIVSSVGDMVCVHPQLELWAVLNTALVECPSHNSVAAGCSLDDSFI